MASIMQERGCESRYPMTIAEVAAEAGAEVEDEAAGVLLPGEATVASGREAEGGHPHPIT